MDSTISSRNSSDSTFNWEESNSNVNLNNALLMSAEEEVLSNSNDEIFYDVNEYFQPLRDIQPEIDMSIANDAEQSKHFSHFFENTDSTNLISLPSLKEHTNDKFDSMQSSNMFSSSHLQHQNSDTEKEKCETNKRVPLKVTLRRMFDEILGKHTKSAKESTNSSKTTTNKFSFLNNLPTNKLADTFKENNNDHLYQTQKSNKSIVSVESLEDPSHNYSSSSENTSMSFLNRFVPRKLVTILENSNENTSNTDIESLSDCSGKHIGRLPNFSPLKLENKNYMHGKMFNTSDTNDNDNETNTSSNISSDIKLMSEEIIRKANNVRGNNSLTFILQNSNKKTVNTNNISNEDYSTFSVVSLERNDTDSLAENNCHTDSIQSEINSSESEEFEDSSAFLSFSEVGRVELSTTNQRTDTELNDITGRTIEMKFEHKNVMGVKRSPLKVHSTFPPNIIDNADSKRIKRSQTPKKSVKKRRSLSLPDAAIEEAENNKTPNDRRLSNSKSPKRGTFYNRTNRKIEWESYSPTHAGRRNSYRVIISPIKPVEYLRNFFSNIGNKYEKNIKQSPMVRKFKRRKGPFISITPATPESKNFD